MKIHGVKEENVKYCPAPAEYDWEESYCEHRNLKEYFTYIGIWDISSSSPSRCKPLRCIPSQVKWAKQETKAIFVP
jgi:hypothetical protein